jgi:hypothetical protein
VAVKFSPFRRLVRFIGELPLYLESGFLQYFGTAECNEQTYRPAFLHYNDEINTYIASVDNPLQGLITLSVDDPYFLGEDLPERESEAVGCPVDDRVNSIVLCGDTYTDTNAVWCDSGELKRLKNVQLKIKPSIFTGKTQLLVQAIYGAKRTDYSIEDSYPFLDPPFIFGSVVLGYKFVPHTTGIYTTTDYRYFLINIGSSSIASRELLLSTAGQAARDQLILHASDLDPATIKKIEAVLLSTCTVSTVETSIALDMSGIIGLPAGYGWQFNWSGSKADIILHRDNLPTDQNFRAYHYRIEFVETAGVITATLTTVSSNQIWSAVHGTTVYRPAYISTIMSAMVNPKASPFSGWVNPATYEAKIYCFYNELDELEVYSLKKAAQSSGTNNSSPSRSGLQSGQVIIRKNQTWAAGSKLSVLKNGSTILASDTEANYSFDLLDWYNYPGTTSPASLTTPNSFNDGIAQIAGTGMTRLQYAQAQGWFIPGSSPSFSTGATGPNGEAIRLGCAARSNIIGSSWTKVLIIGQSKTSKISFVIPYGSSKSVISAVKNKAAVAGPNQKIQIIQRNLSFPGLTEGECHFYDWYNPSPTPPVTPALPTVYSNFRGPFPLINRLFNQAGSDSVTEYTNSSFSDVAVIANTKISEKSLLFETLSVNSVARDKYFDVTFLTDPFGYFYSLSMQSCMISDKAELDGAYAQFNEGYIYDTAIGWA